MSSKASRFKARVSGYGQSVTLYPFSAYASGDYVDANWNAPDPESGDYPASGDPPGTSYGTAQSVKAFVQPGRRQDAGEVFVTTPWGEEVRISFVAFFANDVTVTHRDRITHDGTNHWVAAIAENWDKGTLVYRKVSLTEEVA